MLIATRSQPRPPIDDLLGRFTIGKFRFRRNAFVLKFRLNAAKICCIFRDFRADGVGAVGSSSPSVGDVKEHEPAAG